MGTDAISMKCIIILQILVNCFDSPPHTFLSSHLLSSDAKFPTPLRTSHPKCFFYIIYLHAQYSSHFFYFLIFCQTRDLWKGHSMRNHGVCKTDLAAQWGRLAVLPGRLHGEGTRSCIGAEVACNVLCLRACGMRHDGTRAWTSL